MRTWFRNVTAALLVTAGVAALAEDLLIENVTLISAHLDMPVTGANILVRDGRITNISTSVIDTYDDIPRVDGTGRYLTPGLTDAHHHVSFAPGLGALGSGLAALHPELSQSFIEQQPRSLLYHGVTQILDPSPLSAWRDFDAQPVHPDLFRCGEIPNPGGYPVNQMPAVDVESTYAYRLDEDSPEAVVGRIADDGAICVKLYIEDGFGETSDWPLLDDETVARVRAAAKEHGLLIYAHANAIDMYRQALEWEVDIIGHGLWNWQWPDDPGNPPLEETLDRVIASKTGYIGTHRVMTSIAGQLRPLTLDNPMFKPVVPADLLAWFRTDEAQRFTEELVSDFPPNMSRRTMAEILEKGHERAQVVTRYLVSKEYPIMLGSDCPGSPTYDNQPGLCTYLEIRSHAEAGIPHDVTFRAVTIHNATMLGIDEHYGTIEEGKIANLLLLRTNPLEASDAWNSIVSVILRGKLIDRNTLRADHD